MKRGLTFLTVIAVAAMLLVGCTLSESASKTTGPTATALDSTGQPADSSTQLPDTGPATGTFTLYVTDAPKYTVTSVMVHFSEVWVHKAAEDDEGEGEWIQLTITGGTFGTGSFDLADLQGEEAKVELAAGELLAGKYTQIRVVMNDEVQVDYEDLDGNPYEDVTAKLPSGILKFVRTFEVSEDGETDVLLDFDLQKSVVFTGAKQSENVKVIVKPVVKLSVSEKGKPKVLQATIEATEGALAEISEEEAHSGSESIHLQTTGDIGSGNEARIIIPLPADTTLGMIDSISWWVFNVDGYDPPSYPPHVDIVMDIDGEGDLDNEDMLTAEMAYNNFDGIELDEGLIPAAGEWLQTFELNPDDGYGEINNNTMLWVTKMGAGNDDAPWGTLGNWKDGIVANDPGGDGLAAGVITDEALVLKLEIEIDNWVRQSEVYVDDILIVINGKTYRVVFD